MVASTFQPRSQRQDPANVSVRHHSPTVATTKERVGGRLILGSHADHNLRLADESLSDLSETIPEHAFLKLSRLSDNLPDADDDELPKYITNLVPPG